MILTSKHLNERIGHPSLELKMSAKVMPIFIQEHIQRIPVKIYCSIYLYAPLVKALNLAISRGVSQYIKTWDGCFNIRKKRGLASLSIHSWGLAIDINAYENQLGVEPKINRTLVDCFKEAGFDWGGDWTRKDGMHFQLSLETFNAEVTRLGAFS